MTSLSKCNPQICDICNADMSNRSPSSVDATHTSTEEGGPSASSNLSPIVADESTAVESLGQDTSNLESSQSPEPLTDTWTLNSPQPSSPGRTSPVAESKADFDSGETDELTSDMGEDTDLAMSEQAHSLPQSHSLSSSSLSFPGEYKQHPPSLPLPLPTLLCRASDLLSAYPPSSPALRLAETFGSHSALRIDGLMLPGVFPSLPDDVAESYVGGDDVVLPLSPTEEEEESLPPRRSKNLETIHNGRPNQITNGLALRRQTVFAGVVLFIGVAVALYGFSPGGKGGRNGGAKIGSGNVRYIAAWVGGLLGVGDRLGIGL